MCSGGDYDCCPLLWMLKVCCVCSGGDYDCCPLAVMLKVCCVCSGADYDCLSIGCDAEGVLVCVQVVIMIVVHWL